MMPRRNGYTSDHLTHTYAERDESVGRLAAAPRVVGWSPRPVFRRRANVATLLGLHHRVPAGAPAVS